MSTADMHDISHFRRLRGTASFQLAMLSTAVFAVFAATLFVTIYLSTAAALRQQIIGAVDSEIASLTEEMAEDGAVEVAHLLTERAGSATHTDFRYGLASAGGELMAGDLRAPPASMPGWFDMEVEPEGGARQGLIGRTVALSDGLVLTVAHDTDSLRDNNAAIGRAFLWASSTALLLALGAGVLLSRGFLRRVDAIARTAHAIAGGDLRHRVPTPAGRGYAEGDEMDRLGTAINAMLDRIQDLHEQARDGASAIAHDLRTPLARIRQRLEETRREPRSEADWEGVADAAIAEVDGVLGTFAALLRIAQVESGTRRAGFREVDLSAVFATIAEAYVVVAEDHGKFLDAAVAPGLRLPAGDRELLTQMLANLVENAIRHTASGSRIVLRLGRASSDAAIVGCVEDNGLGIPPRERQAAFRRFHRGEASRTTPGTGLGLALVAAVADLHGIAVTLADAEPTGLCVFLRFTREAR